MGVGKLDAQASNAFGAANYEMMPKSVLAMIAYSFAQRITEDGDRDAVMAEIAREWDALHANGLIPQKPKRLEMMADEADRIERIAATLHNPTLAAQLRERAAELRA